MGNLSELYGNEGFVPGEHEQQDFSPLPPGWYPVEVDEAQIRETKTGTGKYLKLRFTVLGDNYANRKVFSNINLLNPNKEAEAIGIRNLATLGTACGLKVIKDTDDLLGKHLEIKVKIKEEKGQEPQNDVAGYRPCGSAPADSSGTPSPAPRPTAPPAAAKPAGKRPWER